jgi:hypothetical protein
MKVQCTQSGCFLVCPSTSLLVSLPYAKKDEREHYGIRDTKYRVNEASNCVMLFTKVKGS